jgi:hypothetical protein
MVLESNVSIFIYFFVMFHGFDISIVSKNMFLSCFPHVPYKFVIGLL